MAIEVLPDEVSPSREGSDSSVSQPLLNQKSAEITTTCQSENVTDSEVRDTPDILEGRAGGAARDDTASATMVVPPDGGWGWVIVAASFLCNFVVDGILMTFGIFQEPILKDFPDESPAKVTLVGSLMSGFYLMTGPFVSALANRYGFRIVTIIGAMIAATGFAVSSLASSVDFLCVSCGLVGGIGFGMIYAPSIITVGYYFERWRAIATGIAVCGSGIGMFVIAPLNKELIAYFQWKDALLVHAGIILICIVCGALFRPLKAVRVAIEKDDTEKTQDETSQDLLQKIKNARDENFRRTESVASLKANKNSEYLTAAELLNVSERPDSAATVTTKMSKSTQSLNLNNMIIGHNQELTKSVPNFQETKRDSKGVAAPLINQTTEKDRKKSISSHDEEVIKAIQRKRNRTASEASSLGIGTRSRRGTVTECMIRSRRGTITQLLDDSFNRPMYRDDIFFSASLHRLPQYKSETDFMGYTLSVTRLPSRRDLEEEEECQCCPEAVQRTVATMLDLSLLKSPSFVLLCMSGFLTMMGFFTPIYFIKDRARDIGNMSENDAVFQVAVIGITNTIGRVLCGFMSSFPGVDALLINNIALTAGGIATIVSGLSLSVGFQYSYSAVFGFAMACFASLRSIIIVDLLGLEKLTNAFGILLLFQGFAAMCGAPLAASVKDGLGGKVGYDASFYLAGTLILISGLMCFPLNAINRWEKRKAKEVSQENKSHVI